MDKSRKYMIIGIIILLISVVGSIGTYAWFTWTSTNNTNVTLTVGKIADVTFTSGNNININNLSPTFNYYDGVSTTFTINNKDTSGATLLYTVRFNVTNIFSSLKNHSMKYTLLKESTIVAEGDFTNASIGNTLDLATDLLPSGISNYTLYFWIDSNDENSSTMMNKNLAGTIDVTIQSNVLTRDSTNPSAGTSTFLNTTLTRNSIESIDIIGSNTEPTGSLGSFDVSNSQDNSITMWYTDTDNDNLYEVTIGSTDGEPIYANTNSSYLFSYLTNVTSLNVNNLNTSAVTDMKYMFKESGSISSLDLSNFNTLRVESMEQMFYRCRNLSSLNIGGFDTRSVDNMSLMFYDCNNLTSLNVGSFNTAKVTNMSYMFQGCEMLTNLNLSNFNTKKVTNMSYMFDGCSRLTNVDVSGFNTSKVITMSRMFNGCNNLTSLNIRNFDTSKVTDMNRMFHECNDLTSLDLSSFNTSKVTDSEKMFYNCNSLNDLDLSNASFEVVSTVTDMFIGVPVNVNFLLKDTTYNRTLMSNFSGYTPTYVR